MYPGPSRALLALFLLLFVPTLRPTPASAQDGATSLRVSVRTAGSGRPVSGAQVVVRGVGRQATTDASGVAQLRGLTAGSRVISVQFLGFAPAHSAVVLPVEGSVELAFELTPQPVQLAEVRVRAQRPSYLYTNGFHQRKLAGFGTFVTREEIERQQPRYLSDVLRRVSGVNLTPISGGRARASFRGIKSRDCPIQYYVDGTMTAFFDADEVSADDVEGLEIYRGASTVPAMFNRGTAMCGVIVIWTRQR